MNAVRIIRVFNSSIILKEEAVNFRLDRDIVNLLSHNIAVLGPLVAMN